MTSRAVIPVLVTMMLVTGVCNTLLTKYQDMQCVRNCDDKDPRKRRHLEQPVIQTAQMFIGEMGCWLVVAGFSLYDKYWTRRRLRRSEYRPLGPDIEPLSSADDETLLDTSERRRSSVRRRRSSASEDVNPAAKAMVKSHDGRRPLRARRVLLLALPACCDIAGTTLMNVGLLLVAASIYQMTRGALVLFVGLFSVFFLGRRLYLFHWTALVLVMLGVAVVGLAGVLFKDHRAVPSTRGSQHLVSSRAEAPAPLTTTTPPHSPEAIRAAIGIFCIAGAQVFTASQFVLEEWILEHYALEPLKVVGWEGVFGFLVTTVGIVFLHLAIGRTPAGREGPFDAREGWRQVTYSPPIVISSILIMLSIGAFNYFGISVTRSVSATSRSTIDTCRTLFIWVVSLGLGWETFKWLQVVGFVLLVYGTFLFNEIVSPPLRQCRRARTEPVTPLLPEDPIEHI